MDKKFHFMFCYVWHANKNQGNGYRVLQNNEENLTLKDINEAADFIKESVSKQMSHDRDAIKVIFTNIIKLNHCTNAEFYGESYED